jgi:acetyl-CoA carboxylase carboxyl transferase subunit alpha
MKIFSNLSRWQIVQLARHPQRPYTLDYVSRIFTDFTELHGDRLFRDDNAIIAGIGKIGNQRVALIGHQKGRGTKDNLYRNFAMPHPEGYRKAQRIMKLAEKFGIPVLTLIDTPGAYPGLGAEERGQAEAIASNLFEMAQLKVPIIAIVIGEGGSGGALALGVADRVYMLQYSIYSVISPEGCASILYRDPSHAKTAAEAMKVTAPDLMEAKIIDAIIEEPLGGAQCDIDLTAENLATKITGSFDELSKLSMEDLVEARLDKYAGMGVWKDA